MESMERRVRKLEEQQRATSLKVAQLSKKVDENTVITRRIDRNTESIMALMRIGKGGGRLLHWLAPIVGALASAWAVLKFGKPL